MADKNEPYLESPVAENDEAEYEYIELPEGAELPEGYEYAEEIPQEEPQAKENPTTNPETEIDDLDQLIAGDNSADLAIDDLLGNMDAPLDIFQENEPETSTPPFPEQEAEIDLSDLPTAPPLAEEKETSPAEETAPEPPTPLSEIENPDLILDDDTPLPFSDEAEEQRQGGTADEIWFEDIPNQSEPTPDPLPVPQEEIPAPQNEEQPLTVPEEKSEPAPFPEFLTTPQTTAPEEEEAEIFIREQSLETLQPTVPLPQEETPEQSQESPLAAAKEEVFQPETLSWNFATPSTEEWATFSADAQPVNQAVRLLKTDRETLLLTDLEASAADWSLVLWTRNILPVSSGEETLLPLQKNQVRYASLYRNGREEIATFNQEEFGFIDSSCQFSRFGGRFICGDFGGKAALLSDDFTIVSLAGREGQILTLSQAGQGFLSGPGGSLIFFNRLQRLGLAAADRDRENAEKEQQQLAKWYSGNGNDAYFNFSAQSPSGEFVADENCKAIHLDIGMSGYGWNVLFSDGTVMNAADLREYQLRHGKLPAADGEISFGELRLKFRDVERIVVYQGAQYFSYGLNG